MSKIILLIFILFSFLYSVDDTNSSKKLTKYKISKKEKLYQNEKSIKEKEAKKLKEDGFCPCSVQMP